MLLKQRFFSVCIISLNQISYLRWRCVNIRIAQIISVRIIRLFLTRNNDLPSCLSHSKYIFYADDNTVSAHSSDLNVSIYNLQACLNFPGCGGVLQTGYQLTLLNPLYCFFFILLLFHSPNRKMLLVVFSSATRLLIYPIQTRFRHHS